MTASFDATAIAQLLTSWRHASTRAKLLFCVLVATIIPSLYLSRRLFTGLRPSLFDGWSANHAALDSDPGDVQENRHLTSAQCNSLFPDLYLEADRAARWYSSRGGIHKADLDAAEEEGNARLVILNNKLYVKRFRGGVNTRTQAAIAAVYRALLTSIEPLPDLDFVIQTGDAGEGAHPLFALCRRPAEEQLWLMPDFGFFSWPEPGVGSYDEVRDKTLEYEHGLGFLPASTASIDIPDMNANVASAIGRRGLQGDRPRPHRSLDQNGVSSWGNKLSKLFWRGALMVEVRHDLLRASRNQPWSDVAELNWGAIGEEDDDERINNHGDLKTPAEHCAYKYLAHVEGWAYSGRLKYLQQCRSVVVTHPLEWIQHYHHLLDSNSSSPTQNIVEVPLPLEEHLPAAMEALIAVDSETTAGMSRVEQIAQNSWDSLREKYISPAANDCYYRHALRAYASLQTFEPSLEGRSAPYESFLLMGRTQWDPFR